VYNLSYLYTAHICLADYVLFLLRRATKLIPGLEDVSYKHWFDMRKYSFSLNIRKENK